MQGKCSCGFDGEIESYTLNVLDRKVNEYGLRCPQCEKFYHGYYSTTELDNLKQDALAKHSTRKQKRLYVREFNKLQLRYRKIYGTSEPQLQKPTA
jgi:hypothetical protein